MNFGDATAKHGPAAWTRFLQRGGSRRLLTFVGGVRNPVKRGVCCGVHSHDCFEIVYHPTGRGLTRFPGRAPLAFDEGGVVVYAPDERHDQIMETEGEDLCIHIAAPAKARSLPRSALALAEVESPYLRDELQRLSQARGQRHGSEQTVLDHRATAVLMELVRLASLDRDRSQLDKAEHYCLRAERHVEERFDRIGSLREVAAHVGISSEHLRAVFRARRGKSLVRHLNETRIERAKVLLANPGLSLKAIPALCGYRDEYYFSAVFSRLAGLPPGRYRQQVMEEKARA